MNRTELKQEILKLLQHNARISNHEIGERLEITPDESRELIAEMEKDRVIIGYHTFVNEDVLPERKVLAIIEVHVTPERDGGFDRFAKKVSKFPEVRSVYLVSGQYDLRVEVIGKTLEEVATFVSSKLASMEGVQSTATHFMLKKYKEAGFVLEKDEAYERLKVIP